MPYANFYIPDEATILADRLDLTTDALLVSKGFDPANAQPINAPKIAGEELEDETIYDVDRHTWRPGKNSEALDGTWQPENDEEPTLGTGQPEEGLTPATDDDSETCYDIDGARQALAVTVANIESHPADGDNCSLMALHRDAEELRALMKQIAAREALKVRDLSSNRAFRAAVLKGDISTAQRLMLDVIRDAEAPYALRVACITATVEIAPDDGSDYNGEWLAKIADIPLRTAQDLISSSRSLIEGLASELVGTADETRKGVRAIGAMTPEAQSLVIKAVRAFRTQRLLERAGKREKARRVRGISLSELRLLAPIGLCNEEGWAAMTELAPQEAKAWLAETFDKFTATAECKGDLFPRPSIR
jgi:hypothetical protein